MNFLKYTPDVEERGTDEGEIFQKIAETFAQTVRKVQNNEGRAMRVSHAKSTGLLKGILIVDGALSAELAQGIFGFQKNYEVIVRFAQGPGEMLGDKVSTHRGMSVKVLSVQGERIPEAKERTTQDWLTEARETAFINADASKFLLNLQAGVSHAPGMSENIKGAVSKTSRAVNSALENVGISSKMLGFFGHPPLHPLSENYFSQVPIRWGDYIGKLGFYPTRETINSIHDKEIEIKEDFNAFRHAMIAHFADKGAEFEVRIQLATDLDETPVEDASKRWPEDKTPYQRVGRIVIPPQKAWSEERSDYVDQKMSFQPANSIAAHRPLGQVMRARLFVYEQLVGFRQTNNGKNKVEPLSVADMPD